MGAARKLIVQQIGVDDFDIPPGRRPVDAAAVDALAKSMNDTGLHTPITLRRVDSADGEGEEWFLVAGRHRLEAAKKLGWDHIDAIFMEGDELDAELWEISENLHRADLSKEQRDEHIRRYAELLEKKEASRISPQSAEVLPLRRRGRPKGVALKIAEATGLSQDTVHRALTSQKTVQKRNRSSIDADVKARAAKEVADILAEHVPAEWWDGLKANLYAAGAKNIADALTNISGQSIMDRRFA